jgi:Xaa-Pro dipeptidase
MNHLKPGVHWDYMHLLSHRVLIRGLIKLGIIQKPVQNNSASATAKDLSEDEEFIAHILHLGLSAAFYPHGLGHSLGLDVHDVPSISKPLVNPTLRPLSEMPGDIANLLGLQAPKDVPGPDGALFRYLRLRLPLKEGMVVTVEPGCYFHEHLHKPLRTPVPSSSTELNPDAPSFTPGSAVASPARSTWHTYINQEKLALYTKVGGVRIEDVVVLKEGGYENLTTVRSEREWIEGVCAGAL